MVPVKPSRRERAAATRTKIIHAAHTEFTEQGFHGATVAAIASRAGVASQTVYFVFHTKAELISAVIDDAVVGADDKPPQSQSWWVAMEAEPDASEALRIFVRGAGEIFSRAALISEVLRAAALTDDEVRRTHEYHENLRRIGYRQVLELVERKAPLRPGRNLDEAVDALMTLLGDATYCLLTSERGWSHDAAIDWFCDVLPGVVLASPH